MKMRASIWAGLVLLGALAAVTGVTELADTTEFDARGRGRGSMLRTTGSFTIARSTNRAGNDEEELQDDDTLSSMITTKSVSADIQETDLVALKPNAEWSDWKPCTPANTVEMKKAGSLTQLLTTGTYSSACDFLRSFGPGPRQRMCSTRFKPFRRCGFCGEENAAKDHRHWVHVRKTNRLGRRFTLKEENSKACVRCPPGTGLSLIQPRLRRQIQILYSSTNRYECRKLARGDCSAKCSPKFAAWEGVLDRFCTVSCIKSFQRQFREVSLDIRCSFSKQVRCPAGGNKPCLSAKQVKLHEICIKGVCKPLEGWKRSIEPLADKVFVRRMIEHHRMNDLCTPVVISN